jgi:hypothetical protein
MQIETSLSLSLCVIIISYSFLNSYGCEGVNECMSDRTWVVGEFSVCVCVCVCLCLCEWVVVEWVSGVGEEDSHFCSNERLAFYCTENWLLSASHLLIIPDTLNSTPTRQISDRFSDPHKISVRSIYRFWAYDITMLSMCIPHSNF